MSRHVDSVALLPLWPHCCKLIFWLHFLNCIALPCFALATAKLTLTIDTQVVTVSRLQVRSLSIHEYQAQDILRQVSLSLIPCFPPSGLTNSCSLVYQWLGLALRIAL